MSNQIVPTHATLMKNRAIFQNGDGEFVTRRNIGIFEEFGERGVVKVELRIKHQVGTVTLTDHSTRPDIWKVSLIGGYPGSYGQVQDVLLSPDFQPYKTFESATTYSDRSNAERLHELWKTYHLNTMNAGCDHQEVVYEDGPYGRRPSLDLTPPCPETGYRYGTDWLAREVPRSAVEELLNMLGPVA